MLRRLTQDDIEYAISYEIEALLHAEITRQEISTSHLDFFKLSKHALIRRHISKRARSSIHKSGVEFTQTTMANRLKKDTQEIVIVYDGEKQSTWYNGDLSGIDFNTLELSDIEWGELAVTMGRRSYLLWLPFNGTVEALFVSGFALTSEEIQTIFEY